MWWVVPTLGAAILQILRTGLQKQLADDLDRVSVTWVRYSFAAPLAIATLCYFALEQPHIFVAAPAYFLHCLLAGICQIIATLLLLKSFNYKNFAVGTTYAQCEGIIYALLALVFFTQIPAALGWVGIACACCGVTLMARSRQENASAADSLYATAIGLGAGLFFALTIFNIRLGYAAHAAAIGDSIPIAPWTVSALTLSIMVLMQTLLLIPLLKQSAIPGIRRRWRMSLAIGITSYAGSFLWFYCFYIANPAYVKILALVELPLAYFVSRRAFRETVSRSEKIGIGFIAIAATLVVIAPH